MFVKCALVDTGYVARDFLHFKDCAILIIKCDLFNLPNDIAMTFPYVSPEGSSIYDGTDSNNGIEILEDKMLENVMKYPNANLFIAGDLNIRCGNLQDILQDDNVDYIFEEDIEYKSDNFNLNRKSKLQFVIHLVTL